MQFDQLFRSLGIVMYRHAQDGEGALAETSFIRQAPKHAVSPQPPCEANVTVGKFKLSDGAHVATLTICKKIQCNLKFSI